MGLSSELKSNSACSSCDNDAQSAPHDGDKVAGKAIGRYRRATGEKEQAGYRDFSRVPPSEPFSPPAALSGAAWMKIKGESLPVKLNDILSNPCFRDIIMWLPHGRSWRVENFKRFQKEVMPHYFNTRNYSSFIRLVNSWGFRRISAGMDRNSYYHELFLRGLPHLQRKMHRNSPGKKKSRVAETEEPNFYAISEAHPLPACDIESMRHQVSKKQQQEGTNTLDGRTCGRAAKTNTIGFEPPVLLKQQLEKRACTMEKKNLPSVEQDICKQSAFSAKGRVAYAVEKLKPLPTLNSTNAVQVEGPPRLVMELAEIHRSIANLRGRAEMIRCSIDSSPLAPKFEPDHADHVQIRPTSGPTGDSRLRGLEVSNRAALAHSEQTFVSRRHNDLSEFGGQPRFLYNQVSAGTLQSLSNVTFFNNGFVAKQARNTAWFGRYGAQGFALRESYMD